MGFLDKLAFWKKDDEFSDGFDTGMSGGQDPFAQNNQGDPFAQNGGMPGQNGSFSDNSFGDPLNKPMSRGMPDVSNYRGAGTYEQKDQMNNSLSRQVPGYGNDAPFSSGPPPSYRESPPGHDIQVISAKLDALKATMDALMQRVENIERMAYNDRNRRDQW